MGNYSAIARREFLGTVAMGVAAVAQGNTAGGGGREAAAPTTSREMGEPYELAGKRLFFQNWHYIRPGSLAWKDQAGQTVGLAAGLPADAAHLTHTDQPFGIRLVAQPAQRIGPLIEAGQPWEEGAGIYLNTLIKDGGMYRGWGCPWTDSGDPPGQKHSYYLESSDGLTWKRPNLGIVEVNGSRANNIVDLFDNSGGSIFIDPSAPPAERYKLIATGHFSHEACEAYLRRRPNAWDPLRERPAQFSHSGAGAVKATALPNGRDRYAVASSRGLINAVRGAVSPDGLHWTMLKDPLVVEVTDTQITAYYDEALHEYVAYTRTWVTQPRSTRVSVEAEETWQVGRRSIGRSETSDYREFPLHETVLEPGPELLPSDTLYANGRTATPGAPDHHLMFPTIWHTANDSTSVGLATSHDGKLWHFLPGSPVFSTGPFGAFDGGCIFAHPNLVELPDGSFALPYTGYSVPHKYPRRLWKFGPGYAIWPKGRLVALEARERGEFATVGIVPPGRTLRINALTLRGGSISVEVAALDGTALPGRSFSEARPIVGDHYWTPVTWTGKQDLGHKEGTALILRFRMDQAQLFGLEFV